MASHLGTHIPDLGAVTEGWLPDLWDAYQILANSIEKISFINHSQWNTLRDRHKLAIMTAETCRSHGQGEQEIHELRWLLYDVNRFISETRNKKWTTVIRDSVFDELVRRQSQGLDRVLSGFGRILNRDFGSTTSAIQQAKLQDTHWMDRFIMDVDRASPAPSNLAQAYREGNYEHLDNVAAQVLNDRARFLSSPSEHPADDINQAKELTGLIMNVTRKQPAPDIVLNKRFVGPAEYYRLTSKYDLYRSNFVTGEKVMIKVLRQNMSGKDISAQIEKFQRRAYVWHSLRSEYTLSFYGIGTWEMNGQTQIYSVAPFLENGDAVAYYKGHSLSVTNSLQLALDVARGLQYLHNRTPPIVHFGVRTDNILIDGKGQAVLAGFGLIEEAEADPNPSYTGLSNEQYRYLAPELLSGPCAHRPSADVWAWGIVALELVSQEKPFRGLSDYAAARSVEKGNLPQRDEYPRVSEVKNVDEFWHLLEDCWTQSEAVRPHMDDVVARMARIYRTNLGKSAQPVPVFGDPTTLDEIFEGKPNRPVAEGRQPGQK